jgi:hypothetical protein
METKIIDIYMWKHAFEDLLTTNIMPDTFTEKEFKEMNHTINDFYKAKIIFEIPEKKIEITESEIDYAIKASTNNKGELLRELFKKELGF